MAGLTKTSAVWNFQIRPKIHTQPKQRHNQYLNTLDVITEIASKQYTDISSLSVWLDGGSTRLTLVVAFGFFGRLARTNLVWVADLILAQTVWTSLLAPNRFCERQKRTAIVKRSQHLIYSMWYIYFYLQLFLYTAAIWMRILSLLAIIRKQVWML